MNKVSALPQRSNLFSFFSLLSVISLLAISPARADGPEDDYLNVYNMMQEADALAAGGQRAPALAKYQAAEKALQQLRTTYPTWNTKVVSFRLNYLAEKIAALSEKASVPPPSAGVSPVKPPGTGAGPGSGSGRGAGPVKLLDAGAEPRKALRLHPKAGTKQTIELTTKMTLDMKMGEIQTPLKLPPFTSAMDITAKSVNADSGIGYEAVMGDVTVADDPDAVQDVAGPMKNAFEKLKGISGTGTMSNRGINKGLEIKLPTDADPRLLQLMEQMKESFSNVGLVLPEEPVGLGAKWEFKSTFKSLGVTIDQTTTFQLTSAEAERITAKTTITQRAANQKMQNPLAPDMKMDLTKLTGKGTGEVTLDLAQIWASAATQELHSEQALAMALADQKQSVSMKIDLKVELRGK